MYTSNSMYLRSNIGRERRRQSQYQRRSDLAVVPLDVTVTRILYRNDTHSVRVYDSVDQSGSTQDHGFGYCLNDHYRDTAAACLRGLVRTDNHGRQLVLLDDHAVYWRGHRSTDGPTKDASRVKVMAGQSGGHYPALARYVGAGMLDAAVEGQNYGRHPSAGQVVDVIRELDDSHGVLLLVANETSARINYGVAAERARSYGINVKLLAVGDDVIRRRTTVGGGGFSRRRGAAGIVLLCKIAGALSVHGHSLTKIFAVCQHLSLDRIATVNAMVSKVWPYTEDTKRDGTVLLLGTDVNGQNEYQTVRTTDDADMVSAALDLLAHGAGDHGGDGVSDATTESRPYTQHWRNAEIVAMVNNLGGIPDVRFMAIVNDVASQIGMVTGVRAVHRWYTGRMMSAAGDSAGFSVTLMDVGGADGGSSADERVYGGIGPLIAYLDHPASASGWTFAGLDGNVCPANLSQYVRRHSTRSQPYDKAELISRSAVTEVLHSSTVTNILNHVCDRIIDEEHQLNAMDAVDDGDCGTNWRRCAEAVKSAIAEGRIDLAGPAVMMRSISRLLDTGMAAGGTLNSLLSAFCQSCSLSFSKYLGRAQFDVGAWVDSLVQGVTAIKVYGMCQPGDRTMLDALVPAIRGMVIVVRESKNLIHLLIRAVKEANTGCRLTERGGKWPTDPGAHGVKIVLEAILEKYAERLNDE